MLCQDGFGANEEDLGLSLFSLRKLSENQELISSSCSRLGGDIKLGIISKALQLNMSKNVSKGQKGNSEQEGA